MSSTCEGKARVIYRDVSMLMKYVQNKNVFNVII